MDAGQSMSDFLKGDPRTFEILADFGGVSTESLRWQAFVPSGISTYRIMGQEIGQQFLLRGQNRICPACFREDAGPEITPDTALKAYGRILWGLSSARVCPIHKLALVCSPEDSVQHEFFDTWSLWLFEISEGLLDQPVAEGGLYEAHAARRLAGDLPEGWAKDFPIDALGATCEVLGVSVIYGKNVKLGELSVFDLAMASSAGFRLLNKGPAIVQNYFEALRRQPGKPQDRPQARYGRIYDWLKRGAGSGIGLEPLRAVLRDHILEKWPLGPGDHAMDYVLKERRLHSIRTAAKTHDLHPKRLRKILVDAGIIAETNLPDFEVIFDARKAQTLLEQASGSVGFVSAQKRLGMTRSQMESLLRADILVPGEGSDKARPRFTEATISRWLDYFASFPKSQEWDSLMNVRDTTRKYGLSTDRVLSLVMDGSLTKVYIANGSTGLQAVLVDRAEVVEVLRRQG